MIHVVAAVSELTPTSESILVSNKDSACDHLFEELSRRIGCSRAFDESIDKKKCVWTLVRSGIQLDSAELQEYYISGKTKLTDYEILDKWTQVIGAKVSSLNRISSGEVTTVESDLQEAVRVVKLASYVTRSLQAQNLKLKSISKDDNSPVTIADFTSQALIIDHLSSCFPSDTFIAEEDSSTLRLPENKLTCDAILHALQAATGQSWSAEKLFTTLDKGSHKISNHGRTWTLDPVDGTKGTVPHIVY